MKFASWTYDGFKVRRWTKLYNEVRLVDIRRIQGDALHRSTSFCRRFSRSYCETL